VRKNVSAVLMTKFVFLFALVFALFCVNAEGKAGWAGNLPAWRPNPNLWWVKILYWIPLCGREVNGFDLFVITFFIMAFLFIFFWNWTHGKTWKLRDWGELVCLFFVFSVIEDFLWFMVNPYYGLGKFSAQFIPWHKNWLGPLPTDYYIGIAASIGFGILSRGWKWCGIVMGITLLLTVGTIGVWGL